MGNLKGMDVKPKRLYMDSMKSKKAFCMGELVWSCGNIVTYIIDEGISYREEVDSGVSILEPKTFNPEKAGYEFVGWRDDETASVTVLSNKIMEDAPITLYAVFRKLVTLTTYNNSQAPSTISHQMYYNNGKKIIPSFTVAQATKAGWTVRGWSTGTAGNAEITYSAISETQLTQDTVLYGMYQKSVKLTTVVNGSSSSKTGWAYYNSANNTVNPTFTVSNPTVSGAAFKGWSASASSATISNGSINNLTLSSDTCRYAVFEYTTGRINYDQINAAGVYSDHKNFLNVTVDGTKYSAITLRGRWRMNGYYDEEEGKGYETTITVDGTVVLNNKDYDSSNHTVNVSIQNSRFSLPNKSNVVIKRNGTGSEIHCFTESYIELTGRTCVG